MVIRKVLLITLGGFSLVSCQIDELFLPVPPANSIQYTPTYHYVNWWYETRACLFDIVNRTPKYNDYTNIKWFAVSDEEWLGEWGGKYNRYKDYIFIGKPFLRNKRVVTHEIIHAFGFSGDLWHNHRIFHDCSDIYLYDWIPLEEWSFDYEN